MENILLVEPEFPIPNKSKNHKNFLPIGLLKLSSFYKSKKKCKVEIVRGNILPTSFKTPSLIEITSLFTYWSDAVWDTVRYYRDQYPDSNVTKIRIGGIYASLHCNSPIFQEKCTTYEASYFKGVHDDAEHFHPDYECILKNSNSIDYQIVHASRGCFRNCSFCGTWLIEPEFKCKNSISDIIEPGLEQGLKNLVFYDNNLFYNPNIEKILEELIDYKTQKKIGWCESQSGFDGRILLKKPELAGLLKKAGFRNPRIAWDGKYNEWKKIKTQISILNEAGYNSNDIYVFMIYNWDLKFREMEKKRIKCLEWDVQISDCRNRPLDQLHDYYKPLRDQNDGNDYYIHPTWTDAEIKQFRRNVRRQNICIRQNIDYHSRLLENKKYTKEECTLIKEMELNQAKKCLPDLWIPSQITPPKNRYEWSVENVKKPDNVSF